MGFASKDIYAIVSLLWSRVSQSVQPLALPGLFQVCAIRNRNVWQWVAGKLCQGILIYGPLEPIEQRTPTNFFHPVWSAAYHSHPTVPDAQTDQA